MTLIDCWLIKTVTVKTWKSEMESGKIRQMALVFCFIVFFFKFNKNKYDIDRLMKTVTVKTWKSEMEVGKIRQMALSFVS